MTLQETVCVLRNYNDWRRNNGKDGKLLEQPDPYKVGMAIDMACEALSSKTIADWADAIHEFIYTCIMEQDNEKFHDIIRAQGMDLFNVAKRIISNDLGEMDGEAYSKGVNKEKETMRFQVANSALQGILEAKHGIVGEIVPSLLVADALRIADEFIKQWNGE